PPNLQTNSTLKKKTRAPEKTPKPETPLPAASLMDSNTSSYATADSKTPAPNAMITPSHFLLMATDAPSKPPMASDDVAIRPQMNALNMTYRMRPMRSPLKTAIRRRRRAATSPRRSNSPRWSRPDPAAPPRRRDRPASAALRSRYGLAGRW